MLYHRTNYYRYRKNHCYAGHSFLPSFSLRTAHRLLIGIIKHILGNVAFADLFHLFFFGKRFPVQLSGVDLPVLDMRYDLLSGCIFTLSWRCLRHCICFRRHISFLQRIRQSESNQRFRNLSFPFSCYINVCTFSAFIFQDAHNRRCHRSRNRSDYNKNDVFILFFLIPCDAASFLLHN